MAESLLIVVRAIGAWSGPTSIWACAIPSYLPVPLAVATVVAPVLLVGAILLFSRRAPHSHHANAPGSLAPWTLWPFAVIPVLVAVLPDVTGFVGDFLLRQGAILAHNYAGSFPQSLPLDRWIQGTLLAWGAAPPGGGPLPGARWVGLAACTALTLVSIRVIHGQRNEAGWNILTGLVVAGGGYLCIFTGYPRDWVEMLPLTLVLLLALHQRVKSTGPLSAIPELALAALLMLHRSALFLLPAYWSATAMQLRPDRRASRQAGAWRLSVALLVLVAVAMAPGYLQILSSFDLSRHAPWVLAGQAPMPPLLDAHALWNVLNAVLLLAPSAPLAWMAWAGARPGHERRFLLWVVLGWVPVVLFTRPQQGAFRDYDVYACFALSLSYLVAVGLLWVQRRRPVLGRLLTGLAAVSTLQAALGILLVSNSPAATEARVRHGLRLAAGHPTDEHAWMHDYLGLNSERRLEWGAASGHFDSAARLAPSTARLVRAGRAAAYTGDWERSRRWFAAVLARDSMSTIGWCGAAATSRMLGDSLSAVRAGDRLLELCRSGPRRAVALDFLRHAPVLDGSGHLRTRIQAVR